MRERVKDHPSEVSNLVMFHRWSLITASFMQNMARPNWVIKSVLAIEGELLNKGGL